MTSHTFFRLTIEDVFTIPGRGTVLTGRVERGTINVGDIVEIQRRNGETRLATVSNLMQITKEIQTAREGDNVGVILQAITKEDVARGDVLISD